MIIRYKNSAVALQRDQSTDGMTVGTVLCSNVNFMMIVGCSWFVIERFVVHSFLHSVVKLRFFERYNAAPAKVDAKL